MHQICASHFVYCPTARYSRLPSPRELQALRLHPARVQVRQHLLREGRREVAVRHEQRTAYPPDRAFQ